jgi:hypothetical protein
MEPILEFKSEESESNESESNESESNESESNESESEESKNKELESKESKNEKLRKENKKLKKELKKENERFKKELIERNDILVINNKFLINFKNYLNQIIYWYINIQITQSNKQEKLTVQQIVDHYQKILDDYKNKKFYIINSFNIINKEKGEKGFILFINNYGCIYGFNIIRDQWDKIICCNLSKFHISHLPKELRNYDVYHNFIEKTDFNYNNYTQILNNYILNNFTFDYQSELSPNKIKLISKLPFNETYSHQKNVLFSYLNFIYING